VQRVVERDREREREREGVMEREMNGVNYRKGEGGIRDVESSHMYSRSSLFASHQLIRSLLLCFTAHAILLHY
jgi:hypothetical protein